MIPRDASLSDSCAPDYCTHREIFSKSYKITSKSDCVYHFPIDLNTLRFRKYFSVCTAIRRTAVRETGISRDHECLIKSLLERRVASRHYGIKGFKGVTQLEPIMPRWSLKSGDSNIYFILINICILYRIKNRTLQHEEWAKRV